MIEFPKFAKHEEPPRKKMSSEDYLRFCEFCLKNNPKHAAGLRPSLGRALDDIKEPFRMP